MHSYSTKALKMFLEPGKSMKISVFYFVTARICVYNLEKFWGTPCWPFKKPFQDILNIRNIWNLLRSLAQIHEKLIVCYKRPLKKFQSHCRQKKCIAHIRNTLKKFCESYKCLKMCAKYLTKCSNVWCLKTINVFWIEAQCEVID